MSVADSPLCAYGLDVPAVRLATRTQNKRVCARTREFGIRLAIGSAPRHLLTRVLREGAVIAGAGVAAGAAGGIVLARLAGSYIQDVRIPGALPIVGAALPIVAAAILASLMPAARASKVDVIQALRFDQGGRGIASGLCGPRRACDFFLAISSRRRSSCSLSVPG